MVHKFNDIHQQNTYILLFCHFYSLSLRHRSATTAVVQNDFNEKGVIEIIFISEILAKFLSREGNGQ